MTQRLKLRPYADRVEVIDHEGRTFVTVIATEDGSLEIIPGRGGFAAIREPGAGTLERLRLVPIDDVP